MKLVYLAFLIFLSSCTGHHEPPPPTLIDITELAREQQIPKQILAQVDEELKEEFKSSPPLYGFIPLQVQFSELQPGVLKKPNQKFVFPKGGGQVNLADVVDGSGSFNMYFPQEQFDPTSEILHIYFISNSPKTRIDNEDFGLGCGKWNDLKSSFKKIQSSTYLKLNTTDLRYLRVLAGTFVFVFKQGKNIYLSQLTLTHSAHSDKLCGGETGHES